MGEAYHYKNFYIFDALSFLLGSNIFLRCVFVKVAFSAVAYVQKVKSNPARKITNLCM